jgi:hypothetical protein
MAIGSAFKYPVSCNSSNGKETEHDFGENNKPSRHEDSHGIRLT